MRHVIFVLCVSGLCFSTVGALTEQAAAQVGSPISVASSVPSELNPPFNAGPPPTGGASNATPTQAAAFAWQEFIGLNWPAGPQQGLLNQREKPSSTCRFGDPSPNCSLLVWQTFRGKAEIFPGYGAPPGYNGSSAATSWGYDALPQYNYTQPPVGACDPRQANDATPWINLDETDQITLDNMYAGVVDPSSSPGNSAPQLIRFLAKANRTQYEYVAGNQWWSAIPPSIVGATKDYLAANLSSPPAGSTNWVSLPYGTIEIKAAWRPLNPSEASSGRFHTQTVRFYENGNGDGMTPCYHDATWGLVALHIIQKTPSAPFFIYATFEQADNILTADGKPVEDPDGVILRPGPATATTPQVCLVDPKPNPPGTSTLPSVSGMVILTDDPSTCKPLITAQYCGAPGSRLFYRNENISSANPPPAPIAGNICVDKRDNAIPDYVIAANKQAHDAISAYLRQNGIASAPWLTYKLINVQYYPYDKIPNPSIPNGSPYIASPPYTATNPAPSSFYQANIVVETNRSLQLFAGGLSYPPGNGISTEWNQDATMHQNTYYAGKFYNAGGCLGCHGSQGQNPLGQAGDFSVILARGAVLAPEFPAVETSQGIARVPRNRSLR